jgi:branched-chain amino acid transport system substrate-binding protein
MKAMTRRSALSAAIATLAISQVGCDQFSFSPSTPSVIKIGVAQPLTGGIGNLGQDLLNGVKLAVDELNKQGFKIKGKPVTLEIIAVDDKASPEEGKKVAQELVNAGVVAVIGHLNSGVSIPAAPIYASKNIPQLAISSNPAYTELGLPTTFRLVANDNLQAKAVASYAASQIQGNKFAIIDDSTPYGKYLAEASARQLGFKKNIALRQSFDNKTSDFAALAEKIKAENIEVVVSALSDFQVVALITSLKKIDYAKQITIVGTDTVKTTDLLQTAADVGALYCTSIVLDASEFTGGKAFIRSYQEKFNGPIVYGAHYTYDAMHVLAATIKRIESADPAKITQALREIDGYAPVTGSMKWDSKGEQRYGAVSVYAARRGKWESQVRSDSW